MSYIGNEPPNIGAYGVESFNGGGTSFTLSKAAETATVLLFIDGVRQTPVDAYSVSGTTLTTTATTPSGTDNVTVQFLGDVVDFGTPSDNSVTTAKIVDDAVTVDKLANSINTEITANTAKVTNATHTGDVTGATALTIASGAVDLAMLSATGTASSSTFLRGDNAWAAAGETNSPSWFAKITSKQTLSGSTWTVLNNATEQIDPDSAYDNATYAFTVPSGKAGYYFVTGGTMFPNGNDGYHYRLRFTVNGTSTGHQAWGRHESSSGGSQDVSLSLILSLSVTDVVKMEGYTETAGDIGDGGDDAERCFFGGFLIAGA